MVLQVSKRLEAATQHVGWSVYNLDWIVLIVFVTRRLNRHSKCLEDFRPYLSKRLSLALDRKAMWIVRQERRVSKTQVNQHAD